MPVRVSRLELSQLDDGRQQLLVEFGDEGWQTQAVWYGALTADYQIPRRDQHLVLDLHMAPRTASGSDLGEQWARLTVGRPAQPEPRLLADG